jgi:hypothetical protein
MPARPIIGAGRGRSGGRRKCGGAETAAGGRTVFGPADSVMLLVRFPFKKPEI